MLAFTLGISVVWGFLFSLAPLTELFKADAGPGRSSLNLLASGGGRTNVAPVRYRTRARLVVMQVALSVVLLVSAGLLVRGFVEVLRVDPGFRSDRHLTFRLAVPRRYQDGEPFRMFATELHSRLAAIPSVTGVGAISHLPYDDQPNWGGQVSLENPAPPDAQNVDIRAISTGLFETLGVRLLEGRSFTNDDQDPANPGAIVDEKVARQLWPNRSALGQQFGSRQGFPEGRGTVVGVVRHLKLRSLVDDLNPQIFVSWPLVQRNPIAFIVGTDSDPLSLAAQVRAAVSTFEARAPIYDVRTLESYVEGARATRRFTMLLAAAFAACALLLTLVGVYGVLAYAVAIRRHEFGVRRALGADAGQVMRNVLNEGLAFTAIGCLGGLGGAAVASRLLQSQLYAVHPRDPLAYGVAMGLILAGAVVACWIPAYRATRISPMDALRTE